MTNEHDEARVWRRAVVVASCVAALCSVAAVTSAYRITREGELGRIRGEFHRAAAEATASVQRSIGEHVRLLQDAAVLEQSAESADRHRFADLVTPLLGDRGGVRALEWVPRVRHEQRGQYVLAAREAGLANYEFRDRRDGQVGAPAARRPEYLPIYFVEPLGGNELALGFDLAASPTHASMLGRAQDSGKVAATSRVRLAEQRDPAYGVLLAAPVFNRGAANVTVSQRRESLRGFVVGVYTPENVLTTGLGDWSQPDIEVSMWDRTDAQASLLASYRQGTVAGPEVQVPAGPGEAWAEDLVETATISFGDRTWEVHAQPSPTFIDRQVSNKPTVVAGVTGLICFLLGAGGVWVYGRWRRIQHVAARREAELKTAQAAADASRRDKVEFLGAVSYEIRTPLNGLLGMVELMLDTRLDPEQFGYAQSARESGMSLLGLIHDILDYSRMEAGRFVLELAPTKIRGLFDESIAAVAPHAEEKGLAVRLEIDHEVPRALAVDGPRLQKVLTSLLSSAVSATRSGHVALAVSYAGERLRLRIADTSMGLQVDDAAAAAGGGAPSPAAKYWGASLGLAISRKIVALMGGELHVSSVPGEGTEYRFDVVAEPVKAEEVSTTVSTFVDGPTPMSFRGTVLLVEDERVSQIVARKLLEKLGLTVVTANDGVQAVEAASKQRFDVIFMDCRMPNMDGFEATRAIRVNERDRGQLPVPIVALTAAAMVGDREACLRAGMTDYISKPIHARKVAGVLHRQGFAGEAGAANDAGTRAA